MSFEKKWHINGQIIPSSSLQNFTYFGHYLIVHYIVDINKNSTFTKDKIDINNSGEFSFRLPDKNLISNAIKIELYSYDGDMLFTEIYTYDNFFAEKISLFRENLDDSQLFLIEDVDPKEVTIEEANLGYQKETIINGILIDKSANNTLKNVQLIFWGKSEDSNDNFIPIISTYTDDRNNFFTKIKNNVWIDAYVTISGENDLKLPIKLEEGKIPKDILLVEDFTDIDVKIFNNVNSNLPDHNELVNSANYSQDLGGKCIDFTIPNRTLDEFSFYHIVRTSEPEIKSITISKEESKNIIIDINKVSIEFFTKIEKLTESFKSISMMKIDINHALLEDEISTCKEFVERFNKVVLLESYIKRRNETEAGILYSALKNNFGKIDLITSLPSEVKCFKYIEIWNKKFIKQKEVWVVVNKYANDLFLHAKKVVLKSNQHVSKIPMVDFYSNLNIKNNTHFNVFFTKHKELERKLKTLQRQLKIAYCSKEGIQDEKSFCEAVADELILGDDWCKPEESMTMGILCLREEFNKIVGKIKHKKIISLDDISEINSYAKVFYHSLVNFIKLLDRFYSLYQESNSKLTLINDKYFVNNYQSVKSILRGFQNKVDNISKRMDIFEREYILNHSGRKDLSVEDSIDWDDTPTIHQNTTIAHGHILHFKQKWKSDGYSLGDLLYSLPLAPCQEKQISILDWNRKEQGQREEDQLAFDSMNAIIGRDRDIHENSSSIFKEASAGISTNTIASASAGVAGGVGGFAGGVVFGAVAGAASSVSASASTSAQRSARSLSANSSQVLRDKTMQAASSMRSLRSATVETVSQYEGVNALTEVIKNNNHCHSMTVEYFQVLRHYALEEELVDVQECLFVPLPMDLFNHQKVLRWRHTLSSVMNNRKLVKALGSIERIESEYADVILPSNIYAEEKIEEFSGYSYFTFDLKRPSNPKIDDSTKEEIYNLEIDYPWYIGGSMTIPLKREIPLSSKEKDSIFEKNYAPDIVKSFINKLSVISIDSRGDKINLGLDLTLLSKYKKGRRLKVKISSSKDVYINRTQIKHLILRANTEVKPSSNIVLESLYLSYRNNYLSEYIIRSSRVRNDIVFTGGENSDTAYLYTPLNKKELENPKKEDSKLAKVLISFLNENLELAHNAIWSSMSPNRLFGLMDGYIAPNSGNKSVASVVDNKIMGIVGNNLVLKISAGHRLDPIFRHVENLLDHYKPTTKPDPYRVSIPTKGVYTESVMGKCNSCETIDDSRHWRFEDEPCGTKPTDVGTLSTDSRRSQPSNLQTKDLPTNIINMQNAPPAPNPASLGELYALMGKGDSFRDMAGLAGTQANALSALQTTSKSVTDLASISKDFANLAILADSKKSVPRQVEEAKKRNKEGYLSDQETNEIIKDILKQPSKAIDNITGNKKENNKKSSANKILDTSIEKGIIDKSSSFKVEDNDGSLIDVDNSNPKKKESNTEEKYCNNDIVDANSKFSSGGYVEETVFLDNFENNKANLSQLHKDTLLNISKRIIKFGLNSKILKIEGRASKLGGKLYNQKLSCQRATKVQDFLNSYGLAIEDSDIYSYGEDYPLKIKDSESKSEYSFERSVLITYQIPIMTETIKVSTEPDATTKWSLSLTASAGGGKGIGIGDIIGRIRNEETQETKICNISTVGFDIGLGLPFSAVSSFGDDFQKFTTKEPLTFDSFDGTLIGVSGFQAGVFFGYSTSVIHMPNVEIPDLSKKYLRMEFSGPIVGTIFSVGYIKQYGVFNVVHN